jgi:hypothetical protein
MPLQSLNAMECQDAYRGAFDRHEAVLCGGEGFPGPLMGKGVHG